MFFNFNKTSQNYSLQFDFGNDTKPDSEGVAVDFSNQTSLGPCPKCSGAVFAQEKDFVCTNSVASPTNPKPSCNFKTGRQVLQQPISEEQVARLLATGRTDLLDGFVSSRTQKKFTAMLVWDARAGKVGFEFESKPWS
jgi:DNA topoisomerase-3